MVLVIADWLHVFQIFESWQVKFAAQVQLIGRRVPRILAELIERFNGAAGVAVTQIGWETAVERRRLLRRILAFVNSDGGRDDFFRSNCCRLTLCGGPRSQLLSFGIFLRRILC